MKSIKLLAISTVILLPLLASCTESEQIDVAPHEFEPTSESLENYQVPQWYQDAKFGIYFHWAPFSVAAYKTEWYPRWMYSPNNIEKKAAFKDIPDHHEKTWGPRDKFGYKNFIPMFKAEKWDPDQWVALFKQAGAKYVVSAAIHHDGFALWDSEHIGWNSKNMGPKRDIVGEFTTAARKQGLKTGVSTHYGRHWSYYTFRPEYDTWNSKFAGLYGRRRGDNDPPTEYDQQHWKNVLTELIDNYQPDYIFVDGGVGDGERIHNKPYFRQQFYDVLAHYYNSAKKWNTQVVLTYKREFLTPAQAVEDFERSGMDHIRLSSKWQTDDKISAKGWCYVEDTEFWPVEYLIGALMDIVSKNGNLLLNVGPRPDGTLRQQEIDALVEIGKWMDINCEAVYGTTPWRTFGEGKMVKISDDGKRGKHKMGPDCVRFTVKDNILYATCFGWPHDRTFTIKSITTENPAYKQGIEKIEMLGASQKIQYTQKQKGLEVTFPKNQPCKYAYVLKITPQKDLSL
jgi:alpha-L-fucosidase